MLRSLFSVAVVIIFSISHTKVDIQFYIDFSKKKRKDFYFCLKRNFKGRTSRCFGHVFQLIGSSYCVSEGLQETCHVAHTCCVVLYGWIPTSGPKSKQYTMEIGKTKHEHYSMTIATVKKYFQVINLILSLQLQSYARKEILF